MSHEEKRFDPQRKGYLLSSERRARWDPPRFVDRLGVNAGQAVLDVGSGPGFWTLPLAAAVGPGGRVWALDASQELLDDLAAANPPAQVLLVHSVLPQIDLPDGSADLAWAAFVYHEVEPPTKLATELQRVLKLAGRVAILDWRPDASSEAGPPRAHRYRPEQVIGWLTEAGLAGAALTWQDEDAYLIEANKQPDGTQASAA
jgi:ubiquinone/menaquinone biosynthesis C-methylase UbiE